VYQCCWRICREINIASRSDYHMFYSLFPSVTYLRHLVPLHSETKEAAIGWACNYEVEENEMCAECGWFNLSLNPACRPRNGKVGVAVAVLVCIREVFGSNVGQDNGCPD
jgi:hypothetical protein